MWCCETGHQNFKNSFYRPQRSCGQGYVFTGVCDSVHGGGLQRTPPGTKENPPRDQGEPPPGPRRTPPGTKENPPGPRRAPPGTKENPLRTRQSPPPPGRRLQHTVNERPVRIILECNLVRVVFFHWKSMILASICNLSTEMSQYEPRV